MRWLITVASGTDLQQLDALVRAAHGSLRDLDAVPMGPEELVVFAEGPVDLPRRLDCPPVLGVHPDSEPEPY
ncbi:hypothetical protein [Aquipuribacter nitratireducens]|uniref:Uncharacterized protein n=1 Tax=Aquipuribacter nitratireducens TaxID=650104 RepID=A0ABW0GMU9_9MICO